MSRVAKLSQFVKAAKVEPFTLDLEDEAGTKVVFNRPNLRQIEKLSKATGPAEILEILTGDQFETAYAVLGEMDIENFEALLEEVFEALGMGGEGNPTSR